MAEEVHVRTTGPAQMRLEEVVAGISLWRHLVDAGYWPYDLGWRSGCDGSHGQLILVLIAPSRRVVAPVTTYVSENGAARRFRVPSHIAITTAAGSYGWQIQTVADVRAGKRKEGARIYARFHAVRVEMAATLVTQPQPPRYIPREYQPTEVQVLL